MVSKGSAVYEAVNKESRKNFFIGARTHAPRGAVGAARAARAVALRVELPAPRCRAASGPRPPLHAFNPPPPQSPLCNRAGMHNEFVGKRAPRSAAFVCFKPAEEGGEFLLGDGRQILAQLNPQLVKALYERQIRYSVCVVRERGGVGGGGGSRGRAARCKAYTLEGRALPSPY